MNINRLSSVFAAVCVTAASPGYLRRTTDMTQVRASHTMTELADGRVFVAGGFGGGDAEGTPFRTTELYDPSKNRFTKGPAMLVGRSGHTASLLHDGRILFAGGWANRDEPFGTAEVDDPISQRAPQQVTLVVPRAGQTATTLRDGRILLAGGEDKDELELASAEVFDPATGKTTRVGDMSVARAAHTATLLPDGRVAIIGGGYGKYPNKSIQRSVEIFDPATNRFTVAGLLGVARHKHAAALLDDGRILVVGGSDNRDWRGLYDSAEIFDVSTGRSTEVAGMNAKRFKFPDAVVSLAPGRVLIAGGGDEAELYEATPGRFYRTVGSFGHPLFYSAATVLKDGRVLITGGYPDGGSPASRSAFLFSTR